MRKPLLSIGIIFKNEIRCLERCLKSLHPLREAIPCEVVMADTGSDDGSREVAEKYADILINFPWIDDFSAARNAVMDRCSGDWFMFIDADEWLAPDIKELVRFLTGQHNFNFFGVKIRNYKSEDLEAGGLYLDSTANRIVRMSTGMRFQNAIHEAWDATGQPIIVLHSTMFHHDGYLFQNTANRKTKEKRNLDILRKELEKKPDSLALLLQSYESSYEFLEEHVDYIRRAIQGVEEKRSGWEKSGPAIYRHGVVAAFQENLPELDQWVARSEELFPDSIITRLDVNHTVFGKCWNQEDYAGCVRRGEAYFEAVRDYESGNYNIRDVTASPPLFASAHWQQMNRGYLAVAYFVEGQPEKCAQTLEAMFRRTMDEDQVEQGLRALVRLHMLTQWDTAPLVLALWERINEPVPSQEAADKRLERFQTIESLMFLPDFRLEEEEPVLRSGVSLLEPLADQCALGRAAAVYGTAEGPELQEKLAAVTLKDWDELPIHVLVHTLERGVEFPPPGHPLKVEEMDTLASRLAQTGDGFVPLALDTAENVDWENWQGVCWARGLLLAAVRAYPWSGMERDVEQGMALARAFAMVEREFLPRCYTADVLQEDMLFVLPPMHRFGWYCARAFEALEQGNAVEYVRLLRLGLDACEGVKDMVVFLADHTAEVQQMMTPPELKTLADQVRVILARFAPNDPAVAALKQSEAYQKVAHLIEGTAVPVWGGLPQ